MLRDQPSRAASAGPSDSGRPESPRVANFAPLSGVRVLDFCQNVAGPYATQILGDLGADVIKVEPPEGDAARGWGPPWVGGESPLFQVANRNKRAVALNLKLEGDQERALRLAADADVVVEAYRRGVAERLGIGYDAVRARNPKVVYVSVTSHGPTGPLKDDPGYDPLFQARSGLMAVTGEPGGGPVRVGGSVVDLGTGAWVATGVLGALMERQRTGQGGQVTAALLDTALALMSYHLTGWAATGEEPPRMGTAIGMIAPYQAFPCSDGRSVMIAGGNDGVFGRLCRALALDDLGARPEYAENAGRVANRRQLAKAISERTCRFSADALLALLGEHGVPAAPIHGVAAAATDPQAVATGMLRRADHPRIDGYVDVPTPLRWNGQRAALRRFPPSLGEHQREVLEGDGGWPGGGIGPTKAGAVKATAAELAAVQVGVSALPPLLAVAAALGTRDPGLVRSSLADAASHCTAHEVDELLLMSCFVTGFPAGLAAFAAWAELRPPGMRNRDEVDAQSPDGSDEGGRGEANGRAVNDPDRGERACRAVYGSRYEALIDHLAGLHRDLPALVVEYGYGAMMSRPGLPLRTRELCLAAMLAPWRAEPQLRAHLRGALETGATLLEVEAAVRAGCAAARATGPAGEEAAASARRTWRDWVRSQREKAAC